MRKMTGYADLEISLDPEETGQYSIKQRLSLPSSDVPVELTGDKPAMDQFDIYSLGWLADALAEYGQTLSDNLFAAEKARVFFEQARSMAASHSEILRVRQKISCTASKLHQLRLETLRDPNPEVDDFLFADERTPFSRYLTNDDPRPIQTHPREDLKAMVVIVNPIDLDNWNQVEVKVSDELKHASNNMSKIPVDALCHLDEGTEPIQEVDILDLPTLNNLATHLHSRHDILFLICHVKNEGYALADSGTQQLPKVWLEDKNDVADVAQHLNDLLVRDIPETYMVEGLDYIEQVTGPKVDKF